MKYLKPKYLIVMLGSTNVGKSTLMNKMLQVQMLASSEERETDSVYLVEFAREKSSQYRMNMWREDPKRVGNLIKGE